MNRYIKQGIQAAIVAFLLAIGMSFVSDTIAKQLNLFMAFFVLIAIILLGVLADMLGIAVASADETPFHAMAAKKVFGSRQCTQMVRNADRVAIVCNDIIGDICGTVSGALGASIVFRIIAGRATNETLWTLIMIGVVSMLTVGGKAFGKGIAIRYSTYIVFQGGRMLALVENLTGRDFFGNGKQRRKVKI